MEKRKSILQSIHSDYDKLYHYAPIAYMTINALGDVLDFNLNAMALLELEREDRVTMSQFLLDDAVGNLELFLEAVFKDDRPHEIHLPLFTGSGKRIVIQGYGHRSFEDRDKCIVALLPVEERLSADENINRMAFYDNLTGLPNRTLFNERIQFELKHAHRNGVDFSVLFIDLDHFKYVNDTLGHEAGDRVLCEVAATLQRCLRETDLIARLGGDEFAVILRETIEPKDVAVIAGRILEHVAKPIAFDELEIAVGCSIGIAIYPTDGHNKETLLKSADIAMYKAKQQGRNAYVFYNSNLRQKIYKRLDMESKLGTALEEGRLKVHYQPEYDLASRRILGVEALMRWEVEDRVWVNPSEFIPIAERLGLMVNYGQWILEQACQFNRALHDVGHAIRMNVNIAYSQLKDPEFVDRIKDILSRTGCPAELLELEFTESTLDHEDFPVKDVLYRLSALGVKLAMDDYGTGKSSLTYLYELPLNRVKIDRSFITQCYEDEVKTKLIQLVIRLGFDLSMTVTAEGVETERELAFLHDLGCQSVTGFYLAKPETSQVILRAIVESN